MKYAEILTTRNFHNSQQTLTYQLPPEAEIKTGQIVEIPLKNSTTKGLVLSKHNHPPTFTTKAILGIAENLALAQWQLKLITWISEQYFCPLHKILPSFIPKKILSKVKRRQAKKTSVNSQFPTPKNHKLTPEQENTIKTILDSHQQKFLIHGITGSGKTEIYLQLAKHFANQNQQTLILVPEISLTPQTVKYFQNLFPNNLAVIHSKLSVGEKIKAWESIHQHQTNVIIGSRSAIFAPFQNLGAIIIDEEHDTSYKQDQTPRYHARDVATKISELTGCKLILASATPQTESYHQAINQHYQLLSLTQRVKDQSLPQIELIDLKQQPKNPTAISYQLEKAITNKLAQNEQVILFLNKRGSSSNILCKDCGTSIDCSHCDITMTYHDKPSFTQNPTLLCHHCGRIKPPPTVCSNCQSPNIKFYGLGTQKLEQQIQQLFPTAKTLRADKDTTSTKHGFQEIYDKFRNHQADILIGTQMITKGLHLPKVNLVGVIMADIGMHIPDFRAHERIFQILTQVAGRAGRYTGQGKVLIQTFNPEHPIMQLIKNQNYLDFFNHEINSREQLSYPPFSRLIKLTFENSDPKTAFQTAQKTKKELDQSNTTHNLQNKIAMYPALLHKKNNKFRWCILVNGKNPRTLIEKNLLSLQQWTIDINPSSSA